MHRLPILLLVTFCACLFTDASAYTGGNDTAVDESSTPTDSASTATDSARDSAVTPTDTGSHVTDTADTLVTDTHAPDTYVPDTQPAPDTAPKDTYVPPVDTYTPVDTGCTPGYGTCCGSSCALDSKSAAGDCYCDCAVYGDPSTCCSDYLTYCQ